MPWGSIFHLRAVLRAFAKYFLSTKTWMGPWVTKTKRDHIWSNAQAQGRHAGIEAKTVDTSAQEMSYRMGWADVRAGQHLSQKAGSNGGVTQARSSNLKEGPTFYPVLLAAHAVLTLVLTMITNSALGPKYTVTNASAGGRCATCSSQH